MAEFLSSALDAIDAFGAGEMVLVMDDESRESEGHLIIAASKMTIEQTAFILRHTTGILCVALAGSIAERLDLPPMVVDNTDPNCAAFTVSCDVIDGTKTGASACDRCRTCRALTNPLASRQAIGGGGMVVVVRL